MIAGLIPGLANVFSEYFDDSQCDRICASLMAVNSFNNDNVGKQPVAWKKVLCGECEKRTSGKYGQVH